MSPYAFLGSRVGRAEAAELRVRLTAWHDAMVAHERRLEAARAADACDDECPHVEARALWSEALATLGPRASELTFLRSRAIDEPSPREVVPATTVVPVAADSASRARGRTFGQRPGPVASSAEGSQLAQGTFEP
jgi:hypothetical protein